MKYANPRIVDNPLLIKQKYMKFIEDEIDFAKKEKYHGSISIKINFFHGEIKNLLTGVEKSIKF